VGCVEIGWAFRQAVWGRGYATEIGSFGLDHVFSVLGVEEVVSFTEVHNARSRAVMKRLGMRHVGQILRPGFIEGSDVVHEAAPFALYRIARPGERKKVGARRWMYRGAIPTFTLLPRKLPQATYALQSPGSGVCRQELHHHVDDG
jgi:hypothetical protein